MQIATRDKALIVRQETLNRGTLKSAASVTGRIMKT